ncbi:ABC transporter permease [Embleya sp. NPDC050493]|uniref:ABC transporter permease n=1 Tax=Embleya sp. NPDC050493 TaxID=3363989 RepID=UPI0037BAFB11
MRNAVHAEWTKLRTVRSTAWLLLGLITVTVLVSVLSTSAMHTSHCPTPTGCFEDTTKDSLIGIRVGQIAVVLLAVSVIGNEYGTGMIHTSLTALPRRRTLLAGKALLLVAMVAVAGTLAVLGSLWAGRTILAGNGFNPEHGYPALSPTDGPTLRAAAGTVLYLILIALLSLGVAITIRDTAGAVTVLLTLLYILPLLVQTITDPTWHHRLEKLPPMTAGLAITTTHNLDRLPIAPWPGTTLLAGYTAAAVLLATLTFTRRDA